MKLYATVTSERATKGQGGEWLDIKVTDTNKEFLLRIKLEPYIDAIGEGYRGTLFAADHLYKNTHTVNMVV